MHFNWKRRLAGLGRKLAWATQLGLVSVVSFGASFDTQNLGQLVGETPVIVRGKIGASHAELAVDPDGNQRLYTYYEVTLSEVLKSELGSPTVMIRELGGVQDGVKTAVSGTAEFESGEDVVLLLNDRNSDGVFDLHGMMMAKLEVSQDQNGVDYLMGSALANQGKSSMSLAEFKELIGSQASRSVGKNQLPKNGLQPNTKLGAPTIVGLRDDPGRQPAAHKLSSSGSVNSTNWGLFALTVFVATVLSGVAVIKLRH